MDHNKLHKILSDTLDRLVSRKIERKDAEAIFKGARELTSNCRSELKAIELGYTSDVPLLGIKKLNKSQYFTRTIVGENGKVVDTTRHKITKRIVK